jgi:hypothetical protein
MYHYLNTCVIVNRVCVTSSLSTTEAATVSLHIYYKRDNGADELHMRLRYQDGSFTPQSETSEDILYYKRTVGEPTNPF